MFANFIKTGYLIGIIVQIHLFDSGLFHKHYHSTMPVLNGWHKGERSIQKKLGFDAVMTTGYTWIDGSLPEQHRLFHTTRLPFMPITTLDHLVSPVM